MSLIENLSVGMPDMLAVVMTSISSVVMMATQEQRRSALAQYFLGINPLWAIDNNIVVRWGCL